ncbi:single-stranded DNA-binding protein [bacterium]|nr:single-stranded DNA-binding protein [bacterium]
MNVNKAIILGRVTQDPQTRETLNGRNVCTFGVATNHFWKDKNGEQQRITEFHNVVVWGKLADIASQYLKKGSLVYVEGRIQTRSWEDQGGAKHFRTEIIAERLQLGPKSLTSSGDGVEEKIEEVQQDEDEEEINVDEIPF